MKTLAIGAEAIILQDRNKVVKDRTAKGYRIAEIDRKLRSSRTRGEAGILGRLARIGFSSPKALRANEKTGKLEIEFISGPKVKEVLEKIDYARLSGDIGKKIAMLHNNNIIHGDLTTSNMILHGREVYFVDFGLSFLSERVEDREMAFQACLAAYRKNCRNGAEVLKRLEIVEKRGRYKQGS